MSLGEKIKSARLAAGLSQRQLCGDVITRNMLSQIENGSARPSMDTLTHFARQLGKPVGWFLEDTDPEQQTTEQARQLFRAVQLLEQAKEAIAQGKDVYAVSLLEQAQAVPAQPSFFHREWSLLMYAARPEQAQSLAQALPEDSRELCLRAQAAIDRQEFSRAAKLLDAATTQDAMWHYLRGQAALGEKDYALAATHYRYAEAQYPAASARALEICYRELQDYKLAYYYACKQRES